MIGLAAGRGFGGVERGGADGAPGKRIFRPSFYFSWSTRDLVKVLWFDGGGLCLFAKKIGERKIGLAASDECDSVPGELIRWQVSTQRNIITLIYNRLTEFLRTTRTLVR